MKCILCPFDDRSHAWPNTGIHVLNGNSLCLFHYTDVIEQAPYVVNHMDETLYVMKTIKRMREGWAL